MIDVFDFTIFDFETTGLDPEKDKVIEMAAVRVCHGHIVSEFSTLINNGPVSEKITEITGIKNEELEWGMSENAAFKYLSHLMGNNSLIAHNAAFDLAFLHHGMLRNLDKTFSNSFFDTLTVSRDRSFFPHKLTDMCTKYDIKLDGAHRALNDVHGCWELFKKFDGEETLMPWMNKLGYLSKYPAPKWVPEYATLFPTENKYEPRSV